MILFRESWKWIVHPVNDGPWERHMGHFVEHKDFFFHMIAYTTHVTPRFQNWYQNIWRGPVQALSNLSNT
jgi:hypothetical protein